jgi:hypothetical protein
MRFLRFRRYLDKHCKGTKSLLINPLLVTQMEAGDNKNEVLIWMSGAYGPSHVVGDIKMVVAQVESAISSIVSKK